MRIVSRINNQEDWRLARKAGRIAFGESDRPAERPVSGFLLRDWNEPTHVHVKRDNKLAKFWLAPVRMAYNRDLCNG